MSRRVRNMELTYLKGLEKFPVPEDRADSSLVWEALGLKENRGFPSEEEVNYFFFGPELHGPEHGSLFEQILDLINLFLDEWKDALADHAEQNARWLEEESSRLIREIGAFQLIDEIFVLL